MKPVDFVGIELQTLDTTGTIWPAREQFLQSVGVPFDREAVASAKSFGMNWKMTAKTALVQLHHKIKTFENLGKHLVLVIQDRFLDYMNREFSFGHLNQARVGDSMHFHAYALEPEGNGLRLRLVLRRSTDADGVATALGLHAEAHVELEAILCELEKKLSASTLWTPGVRA